MKWHKISDGDYPNEGECVLVAHAELIRGVYKYYYCDCQIAQFYEHGAWVHMDKTHRYCESTDRWAYIDLPMD